MAPFSIVLHYLEGDSIPLSHVYPLFQSLFDYVICLPSAVSTVLADMDEGIEATIVGLVTDRWEGTNRLVGLRQDVHLATFFFYFFARAAVKDPTLITQRVCAAADRCVSKLAGGDPHAVAMVKQMLHGFEGGTNLAVAQKWEAAQMITSQRMAQSTTPGMTTSNIQDEFACVGEAVFQMVHNLKQADHPTTMWIAARNIVGSDMNATRAAGHMLFSSIIVDLSSIVGHTSATERHGKGYKLIHTSTRSRLLSSKLNRAMFVFNNYNLMSSNGMLGLDVQDFAEGFLSDEEREQVLAEGGTREHLLEGDASTDSSDADCESEADGEEGEEGEGEKEGEEEQQVAFVLSSFCLEYPRATPRHPHLTPPPHSSPHYFRWKLSCLRTDFLQLNLLPS